MKSHWTWVIVLAAALGCDNLNETTAPAVYQQADDVYQAAAARICGRCAIHRHGDWDYNVFNHEGMTPLHAAVKGGNIDIVGLMIHGRPAASDRFIGPYRPSICPGTGRTEIAQALEQMGVTQ